MAEDGEVLRQIWDSHLPVSFTLSSNDLYSMKNPEPYYSMVPRLSYFSLVIDKVIVYFSQFIDSSTKSKSNLWLDFLGMPLKFNYPIGLLYDLYAADIQFPWSITVNFDSFPDSLLRCNTPSSMKSTFLYSLKESDALKRKSPIVNKMPERDHNQLWSGIANYRFEHFWSINRRLMKAEEEEEQTFQHIPFRFYLSSKSDKPVYIQRLMRPVLDNGKPAQFKHLIVQTLGETVLETSRFVIHGIEPPLDTPLQWMSEHLSYLDNFLHICVHDKS